MLQTSRLKVTDLNPNLTCILCGGYFIDATTIVECLHSFCKSCIVKYLDTSKFCPICDVQVHKTKPLLHIRSDKTLQDIVYKLVPKAFLTEMRRRKDFYYKHPDAGRLTSPEDRGECVEQRVVYDPDENISLSLEYGYGTNQRPSSEEIGIPGAPTEKDQNADDSASSRRFLLCKAAVRVAHLKKLINMKYDLTPSFEVDIMYLEELLDDDFSLMDIAYIYSWRRIGPMRLFYRIRRKTKVTTKPLPNRALETAPELPINSDVAIKDDDASAPARVMEAEVQMEVEEEEAAPAAETHKSTPATETKSKSNKRSVPMTSNLQTVTIVPPVNPAAKRTDSEVQGEPRTKRLCLKVAVSDPSKSPSNSSHLSPPPVSFASPISSPSAASSTTSESSSGKSSKRERKRKNKDKEGGKSKDKHREHSKHKESSKELLRIKEYLRTQELGARVKDKSSKEGGKSKEHHHHHHHHKSKDGTKSKSSSKTKEPKVKEAIPKFKMATKLKDIPKLTTQTVKIKDMPEIRPVEKECLVVAPPPPPPPAKEPPIKIKEILKNKDAKYKEVYTFTQNPQKSKELSGKSKDYIKFREFPKSTKVKEKKKDKSHKQRRSSSSSSGILTIPTEITVTKTFIPPVETLPPPTPPTPPVVVASPQTTVTPLPDTTESESRVAEKDAPTTTTTIQPVKVPEPTPDPCKFKVATLVIPGFTVSPRGAKSPGSQSLPSSPLYSSLAAPEPARLPSPKPEPARPASTPSSDTSLQVMVVEKDKPEETTTPEVRTEKDEEAEMPDEADSGRGSDFSSRTEVRSSCDDDIGSPSPQTSCSTTPTSVAPSTPAITITVTKTVTPPVADPVSLAKENDRRDRLVENAKTEMLSRKAVVEVKKVDDIRSLMDKRPEKSSTLSGNIKTYSKASYLGKDNAVKVSNTGTANLGPAITVTIAAPKPAPVPTLETKNSVENIRINLENNQVEITSKEVETKGAEKTKQATEKATEVDNKKEPTVTIKPSASNSANNNVGGNNNNGEKAEEPKKTEIKKVVEIGSKPITISIKTPTCPTIQNRLDDKTVRSPPPPVASPKLPEPPVAATGSTMASAPSASPPTTASFLQPSVHHPPQNARGAPSSPQYQLYRHFSPTQHNKTVKNKGQVTLNQPTILPLIVKQNSPHPVVKAIERKRKEPTPSTSGASTRVPEPTKDDIGALDLSVAPRHDRPSTSHSGRPRNMVANPPVLDKHRIATCLQAPKFPSYKITGPIPSTSSPSMNLPSPAASSTSTPTSSTVSVSSSGSLMKRSEAPPPPRTYRSSGKNLTVINHPDHPRIVIKSLDARPADQHHGHHGHHSHHNHHHRS